MEFTNEQMQKARMAKSAEELFALAKAENFPMTEEEAQTYFVELHKEGELSDKELDSVAGGSKYSPEEYDVMGSWSADGCGCGSFSPRDSGGGRECANCTHFARIERGQSAGKCRREFEY